MTVVPAGRPQDDPTGFFHTIRGEILTAIPALSALTFVIVAVKVFRASGMEATTTVAVVSAADPFVLLKGVVLTLLPGFLTAVTAMALWWWGGALPTTTGAVHRTATDVGLLTPEAAFGWVMVVMAFFTVSWPLFLLLFLPAAVVTAVLVRGVRGAGLTGSRLRRLRVWLRAVTGSAALLAVAFLALTPSLWVPLRTIEVEPGRTVTANGEELPRAFAAYVLGGDDDSVSLLLADPRAVVEVGTDQIAPHPQLCVTPESPFRGFYLRASQVLGIDPDDHSPYPLCPELDTTSIFGS